MEPQVLRSQTQAEPRIRGQQSVNKNEIKLRKNIVYAFSRSKF
jgi:hypothetical protein